MDGSALKATLQKSRDGLLASLRGLGEEQFRHTPDASWNIATHLAHLLRTERAYVARASAAARGERVAKRSPAVDNGDDPALAQRLAVPQIIHGLQAARRQLEALLDEAGGDALTVTHVAGRVAAHESSHAGTIASLARSVPQSPPVIPLTPRA